MVVVITLLTGNNTFEIDRALKQQRASFAGEIETFEGNEVSPVGLRMMLGAQTLFMNERFVVLREPAESKELWTELPKLLESLDDSVTLVIVQPGVDKRTATYKWLQKYATVEEFKQWTEHDTFAAEQWATNEAKNLGLNLNKKLAHQLVARTGNDQWRIVSALEKLMLATEVDEATIIDLVEATPSENVFSLLETALSGTPEKLHVKISELSLSEDAYKVLGLLSSQVFQLAVLHAADGSNDEVAKDLGAHPFVLSKLASHAKRLSRTQVREIMQILATADMRSKSTDADRWTIIEDALMLAQQASKK